MARRRYELIDREWAIEPLLPNKPRDVARVERVIVRVIPSAGLRRTTVSPMTQASIASRTDAVRPSLPSA